MVHVIVCIHICMVFIYVCNNNAYREPLTMQSRTTLGVLWASDLRCSHFRKELVSTRRGAVKHCQTSTKRDLLFACVSNKLRGCFCGWQFPMAPCVAGPVLAGFVLAHCRRPPYLGCQQWSVSPALDQMSRRNDALYDLSQFAISNEGFWTGIPLVGSDSVAA